MDKIIEKAGGNLKISSEVIQRIAEMAATEITGVAADGHKPAVAENVLGIPARFYHPVSVRMTKEAVEIDVSIVVIQGNKAVSVAEAVQNSIKSAVQNMTGIPVAKVNVNIAGVRIVNDVE